MDEQTKENQQGRLIWVGLSLTLGLLALGGLATSLRLRSSAGRPLPILGTVSDFTLTNQDGAPISLATLRGHPWIADIIFTRCAGPCPRMTRAMSGLQAAIPARSPTRLVTLTTDPVYDTPPVLRAYAAKYGADTNRWLFLTGAKAGIAALAVDSLKLTALEVKPEERQNPEDLFVHSTLFVLVDGQGRLRGIYETESEDSDPVQTRERILSDLGRLEADS